MITKIRRNNLIRALLFIAPFLTGLLSEWSLYLFGILCICAIVHKVFKNGKIVLPLGKNIIFVLVYLLSFLIVQIYAVDKGMNLFAFFKNLVILLFILLFAQYDHENDNKACDRFYEIVPYSAVFSVILCLLLMLIPNSNVFYNNRLQGIFYYANSYGLFLLIGLYVLFNKDEYQVKDYVTFIILFIGIILTNSRAIIIMSLLMMVFKVCWDKKEIKRRLLIILSFIILFCGFYFFSNLEKRVDTDMLQSSELITRLLYYNDAVKMIKDNPWGYGYEGWYYKQCELQTGVYDTKYVHNSVLQLMLDVGFIPAILLIFMLISSFFEKKQTTFSRVLMILILGHSLIDIDLEYIYFILLLVPLINFNYKEIDTKKKMPLLISCLGLTGFFYFIIFMSDSFYELKDYKNAISIIPFHTEAIQEILYTVAEKEEQLKYAELALKYNKNISGAYEAKINKLVEENEYMDAIELEEKRLSLNKYKMINYIQYAKLLSDGIEFYGNEKKTEEQRIIVNKVAEIESKINDVLEKTNPLCYKTIHIPDLELPAELQRFINTAKNSL